MRVSLLDKQRCGCYRNNGVGANAATAYGVPVIFVDEVGVSGEWIVEVGGIYGAVLIEVTGERSIEREVWTGNSIADRRPNAVISRVFAMEGGAVHYPGAVEL
jgi:hypothetical protein